MDDKLFSWLAQVRGDPLAFTMGAFPWNEPGTVLENSTGPEDWARDLMNRVRDGIIDRNEAIQEAIASGHGIAKSATVSMLIMWAFTTFPDTRGVVTANTETQLKTKTWAELGKWFNLCFFAREHFTLTATGLFSKDPDRERTWRIDMIPWSEKNPAAFAGLHNKGKRLLPQVRGNARNADRNSSQDVRLGCDVRPVRRVEFRNGVGPVNYKLCRPAEVCYFPMERVFRAYVWRSCGRERPW